MSYAGPSSIPSPSSVPPIPAAEKSKRKYAARRTLAQWLDIVLEALRKAGFTPTEFLRNLLTAPEERFARYHDALYKDSSSRLSDFLDVVWEDPKGHEHLTEWMGCNCMCLGHCFPPVTAQHIKI